MKDRRCIILAAMPTRSAELRTIFSDQPESIRRKLENPPRLRDSGWDLPSSTPAEFVRGELIRATERGRIIDDLYRDGTFILEGQVDRDFLAWSDKDDLRLHPLALIEVTVNFTRFYGLVLDDFRTRPERIRFKVELRNMHLGNQKTRLGSGPIGPFSPFGMAGKEAPESTWSTDIVVPSEGYNPDLVAFSLIRELYFWFGHPEEAIPYTKETPDGRVIDANQIASIR